MDWNFELVAGPYGSPTDGPVWDGESVLFTRMYDPANSIDNRILRYNPQSGEVTDFRRWTNRIAGLTIAIHVMGGEAARNVILGGADSIEHGFELSDDLLRLMKEKGVVLVGTDFPAEHLHAMGDTEEAAKEEHDKIVDRLRRAHKIGVKMAFGTDVILDLPGKNRGQMSLDYLEVWQTAGIPAPKILKCLTANVAELLKIEKERGAIAIGQFADIVAPPQNPLDDIQALRKVHFVMKNGEVIKRPGGSSSLTNK